MTKFSEMSHVEQQADLLRRYEAMTPEEREAIRVHIGWTVVNADGCVLRMGWKLGWAAAERWPAEYPHGKAGAWVPREFAVWRAHERNSAVLYANRENAESSAAIVGGTVMRCMLDPMTIETEPNVRLDAIEAEAMR